MTYENHPSIIEFIKHRYTTNSNLIVEATLYSIILGIMTYVTLSIVSYKHIFYTLLIIIFFYLLFTNNNNDIRTYTQNFITKLKYISK